MQKIFEENAVEIIPYSDGIIIVCADDNVDDKVYVSFKYYSPSADQFIPVTREAYMRAKFGDAYKQIQNYLEDYVNFRATILPDGRLICVHPDTSVYVFALDGSLDYKGELSYRNCSPCGITCIANSFWVSFPSGNTLVRYNVSSLRPELRIGSRADGTFDRPINLASSSSNLIVCNCESNCVESVDIVGFSVERMHSFDEPVYQYVKLEGQAAVLLKSGVYIL